MQNRPAGRLSEFPASVSSKERLRRIDSYTGKEIRCGQFSLLPEFQYRSGTKQESATRGGRAH